MLLLTWHGTILRVEQAENRLTHAPLLPVRPTGRDYVVDLPPDALLPRRVEGQVTVTQGNRPSTVHLMRRRFYLSAEPHAPFPAFTREGAARWETFLPITEQEAAVLRTLLARAWREPTPPDNAAELHKFTLGEDFRLTAGTLSLDLTEARPSLTASGTILVPFPEGPRTLRPGAAPAQPPDIHLRRTPRPPLPPEAGSVAAFRATPGSSITLPESEEFYFPPLVASLPEREWTLDRAWPGAPLLGRQHCQSRVVHSANAFVLLNRGIEGMVFDAKGVESEPGYLSNLVAELPPHFAREGNEFFLSAIAMQGATVLHGPHAVFYGGNLIDPFNWIIGGLVPLTLLHLFLPEDTTLLLPATLEGFETPRGASHLDMLEAFGFGDMKRVIVPGQLCMAQDLYRPDRTSLHQLPASALFAARDRALARLPPAGPGRRRIYIRPHGNRRIVHAGIVEKFLARQGIEAVSVDRLSFAEQIELFRQASLVVGAHASSLTGILFCPPGAAVMELSPACQYRPHFNTLSGKLGLVHAVLPCPSWKDEFDGDLNVPLPRLRVLLNLLAARTGAPAVEEDAA